MACVSFFPPLLTEPCRLSAGKYLFSCILIFSHEKQDIFHIQHSFYSLD